MRDRREAHVGVLKVPGEEHKRHVARVVAALQARDRADLQRGLLRGVEHLRRVLDRGLAPGVDELLEEHLAKHTVRLLVKARAKHHRHTVVRRENVHRLVRSVVNRDERAGRRRAARVKLLLELRLLLKRALKRRRKRIALQQRHGVDQRIALGAGRGHRLVVKLERHTVVRLDLRAHPAAVHVAQRRLDALLDELGPAPDVHRERERPLLGRLHMVRYAIKVGKRLVHRSGST